MTCIWLLLYHTLYIVIPLKRYARWFSVFCWYCWMDWLVIFSCFSFSLSSVRWSEKHFSFLHRMVCSLSSIHIKRIPWYMLHKWCTHQNTHMLQFDHWQNSIRKSVRQWRGGQYFLNCNTVQLHIEHFLCYILLSNWSLLAAIFLFCCCFFYVFAVDHGKTGIWFSIDFASHVCHKNQIYMIYEM